MRNWFSLWKKIILLFNSLKTVCKKNYDWSYNYRKCNKWCWELFFYQTNIIFSICIYNFICL